MVYVEITETEGFIEDDLIFKALVTILGEEAQHWDVESYEASNVQNEGSEVLLTDTILFVAVTEEVGGKAASKNAVHESVQD